MTLTLTASALGSSEHLRTARAPTILNRYVDKGARWKGEQCGRPFLEAQNSRSLRSHLHQHVIPILFSRNDEPHIPARIWVTRAVVSFQG